MTETHTINIAEEVEKLAKDPVKMEQMGRAITNTIRDIAYRMMEAVKHLVHMVEIEEDFDAILAVYEEELEGDGPEVGPEGPLKVKTVYNREEEVGFSIETDIDYVWVHFVAESGEIATLGPTTGKPGIIQVTWVGEHDISPLYALLRPIVGLSDKVKAASPFLKEKLEAFEKEAHQFGQMD